MDFITQNLLGAVAGHAAVGRSRSEGGIGRLALLAGAAGGAVPDFDFLLKPFADPALPMELHRHFTHALVFIPVGAVIAALPFLAFPRGRREFRPILAAAFVGCATHGLLDNLTSYGTHLLWPFIASRTAWDSMSIIDPIFSGVLLVALIATLVHGRCRTTRLALAFALAYIGFGFIQHGRAATAQRAIARFRGHEIEHARALPTLGNLLVFRSVYEADGRIWADAIRVEPLGGVGFRAGASRPRFLESDLPPGTPAATVDVFQGIERFADGFLAAVDGVEDELVLGDVRLSMVTDGFRPLWGIAIGGDGAARAWSAFGGRDDDARRELGGLWDDLIAPTGRFEPVPGD